MKVNHFEAFKALKNIPVQIDQTLLWFLILLSLGPIYYGNFISLIIWPMLFLFALLHEYGHCYVAQRLGFPTKEIKLWPLGALASIEGLEKVSAIEEIAISLAGPCVNIVLSIFFAAIYLLTHSQLIEIFWVMNVILALFNLIPAFPMDGGRTIRAMLFLITKDKDRATRLAAIISVIISFFLITLSLMVGYCLIAVIFTWIMFIAISLLNNDQRCI